MNDKRILSLSMPIAMAFLLLCLTNTGLYASELESFFDVRFSESIRREKFKRYVAYLVEEGISPVEIRDYDAKKDLYVYKYKPITGLIRNPFDSIETVYVKTNPNNGRIKQIFSLFSYTYNDKAVEQLMDYIQKSTDYIQTKYKSLGVELVTEKGNPNLWTQITQAQFGTSDSDKPLDCNYFCFKNNAGIITQIITVGALFDEEKQRIHIKIQAEETAEKHKLIEQEKRLIEQATKENDAQDEKRWNEEVAAMPEIDSFCGIKFGSVLNNGYETIIGKTFRCLSAEVEMNRPFRGIETARVYAGIKTKRIFEIKIGPFDDWDYLKTKGQSWIVVARKFNPNHNPLIQGYRGYYDGRLHFAPNCEIQLKNVAIDTISSKISTGEFEPVIKEIGDYAVATAKEKKEEVYFIRAMHKKYRALAEDESKTDDGSDVL